VENSKGNWNHLKIIQKIPEQHTGKARNQVATENIHFWYCTHTVESAIDLTLQIALYAL
jgi:hypothetical protein